MNSVFNLASHNLNYMDDEELLTWLRCEGLTNMPPIIRTLAQRLETLQSEILASRESVENSDNALRTYDTDVDEGIDQLDDELGHFVSDLEKVSDAILESGGKILLSDGTLIDDLDLDEESPDDQIVISRRQLDAIRAQIDSIGYAISNLETREFFPASPTV